MEIHTLLLSPRLRRASRLAAALLVGTAAAAAAAPEPTSGFIQYEQTTTVMTPARPPLKMVDKLWFKGRNFRREDVNPTSKTVIVSGPEGTFVILPGGSGAMRMASPPVTKKNGKPAALPPLGIPGLMFPTAALVPHFAKKVGTETVGRYRTVVYEVRSHIPAVKGGRPTVITNRYWVSPALPVPVKSMTTATPGSVTVSVLRTAQFNNAVPDSMFRLPKGTKIHPAPVAQPLSPRQR